MVHSDIHDLRLVIRCLFLHLPLLPLLPVPDALLHDPLLDLLVVLRVDLVLRLDPEVALGNELFLLDPVDHSLALDFDLKKRLLRFLESRASFRIVLRWLQ